jgi:Predicted transcriptional regulator
MRTSKYLSILKRIDFLTKRKQTGNSKQLAQKLNCSTATIYRYLNDLKSIGAPIAYSKMLGSYYYYQDFELDFGNLNSVLNYR